MSSIDPIGADDGGSEPDDDLLAGEYVLGVLETSERQAVQTRMQNDATLTRQVEAWEQCLSAWTQDIEPVPVQRDLWPELCTRLGWSAAAPTRAGWWHSLAFWRAMTAVAAAVAIAAFAIGYLRPPSLSAPITTLASGNGMPEWLAAVDARRGTLQLSPVPGPPDAQGRVPELWLIAAGRMPLPVALLPRDRSATLRLSASLRAALSTGGVLAVSLEPPGGAPNGSPTGPIIAQGMIQL